LSEKVYRLKVIGQMHTRYYEYFYRDEIRNLSAIKLLTQYQHQSYAMYIPTHFKEDRTEVLHQLIANHPLGTLITMTADGLNANHIPLMVDAGRGMFGTLRGHVARSNTVWQTSEPGVNALVVFQGPEAYISPSWYPSKKENDKVVPTWNYAVVHAAGPLVIRDDETWMREFLNSTTDHFEATRNTSAPRWKMNDAPEQFLQTMMRAVVGIEIPIANIEGKWKVSQNRAVTDREGVATALQAGSRDAETAMGKLVKPA
jgi:transcriptional regulator